MANEAVRREYYGFVLYLASIVLLAMYLIWALVPDPLLAAVGITYYPPKYLALALPIWVAGLVPFTILVFTGLNLVRTPGLGSASALSDSHASVMKMTKENIDRILDLELIPELEDVPIEIVNQCLTFE